MHPVSLRVCSANQRNRQAQTSNSRASWRAGRRHWGSIEQLFVKKAHPAP
jgi:hypothetical protein